MFISKKKNKSDIKKLSIIKSIISDEMNKECFDCGSLNPEYVSINNSIFLCEKCSFLHRKYHDEISKIIPNNLYKLEEKELYYLYFGGNRKLSEFIYLNPKLSKYKSDILYKMNEMRYYRNNLANIVNEKLGINKTIENYQYKNQNFNYLDNNDNVSSLNLRKKYNHRNILYMNESDDFENVINNSQFSRFSTTNKISSKYKKRYIPSSNIEYINNNRISVHTRKPAILLNMDYINDSSNHSKNNSNLVWLNNLNEEGEQKINSYGHLGRTNFNYKNYINNTINISNSNNNNFYFNQSETDIDNFKQRNSANKSYISFNNNKFKFEFPKKLQIQSPKNSSLNLSTYRIYSKPKLPKCTINTNKNKKDIQSLNFDGFYNNYTMKNIKNNNILFKDFINGNNNFGNIRKKYNKIKSIVDKERKLYQTNNFSDGKKKQNIKVKINSKPNKKNNKSLNSKKYDISNNCQDNNNALEELDEVENISIKDINKKENNNELKQEKKKNKKFCEIRKKRRNLEKDERRKMEYEEKRRKEEQKKMLEEKENLIKLNRKKLTKKERLKLIEEERFKMQQEEIKAKKKKAFENKVIKEEDEEYEQELDTPKKIVNEKETYKFEDIKEIKDEVMEIKDNNNIKKDVEETFKNSIRNRYKRKKNKI